MFATALTFTTIFHYSHLPAAQLWRRDLRHKVGFKPFRTSNGDSLSAKKRIDSAIVNNPDAVGLGDVLRKGRVNYSSAYD